MSKKKTENREPSEREKAQGLTLGSALLQRNIVYKYVDGGYYIASKANLSPGYYLDFRSFDPTKQSSVSTSHYYGYKYPDPLVRIARHAGEHDWQLNQPSPELLQETLVRFAVEVNSNDLYIALVATPDGVRHVTEGRETVDEVLLEVQHRYGVNSINTSRQRVEECSA